MTGFNYTFDASQYAPEQGGQAHPIGKFPAFISNTAIQPTKDNDGGMFVVEFTTEAGKISNRYNLWNQSQKAVDIAHKQLSALCHSVGVFRVDMQNEGAALRNARLMIEVGKQKDSEYTEVKRVFDPNGNEPGKAGAPAPAPSAAPNPGFGAPAAAPAGNWGGQPAAAPAPAANAWGGQPNPAPADHGQPPANAWGGAPAGQPGPAPSGAPGAAPWGGGQPTQAAPAPAPSGAPGWSQGGQPAPAAAPWGQR